jgi:sugar transferase EpsL
MLKRIFDLILAQLLLILLAPLIVVLALLVRIVIGKPVLFRQQRSGLNGQPFILYKFRTMTDQRDKDGKLMPDLVRLTALGQKMRKYSLDELPQLLNILRGDLSFVGPRPLLMEYLERYSERQARRHEVKPGITGWAQVNGRNAISWEEKFELDVWYVDNRNFLLDLKILWLTALKVIKAEGISGEGLVTMSKFMGSGRAKND